MKKRSANKTKAVKDLNSKETMQHYNAVLIEHLNSNMKQVIEGMESIKWELTAKFDEHVAKIDARVSTIEAAIGTHTRLIRENTVAIEGLQSEMHAMDKRLTTEMRGIEQRMASRTDLHDAEQRLFAKIDSQSGRLENHEARISTLEAVRA